jgi:hypothetical protein
MPRKPKPVDNGPEFQSLLRKLVRVPKDEVEAELKADRRRRRRRKKK